MVGVCLCVYTDVHTLAAAGSAPGSRRFGHRLGEEELEIRRREPLGVCRIRGVNELGAPGRADRPRPRPGPELSSGAFFSPSCEEFFFFYYLL